MLLYLCLGKIILRGVSRLFGHVALQGAVPSPQPAWELLYSHLCAWECALAWGLRFLRSRDSAQISRIKKAVSLGEKHLSFLLSPVTSNEYKWNTEILMELYCCWLILWNRKISSVFILQYRNDWGVGLKACSYNYLFCVVYSIQGLEQLALAYSGGCSDCVESKGCF